MGFPSIVRLLLAFAVCYSIPATVAADGTNEVSLEVAEDEDTWDEELDMSELEMLMQTEVTSVSGVGEQLKTTPAAIYVITSEDLRRGGFRSIPDALRLVPGMFVGQITASTWAVSSRGFGARFSNKLLVLVDGRAIYNDVFSGVFWDEVNVLIEDIERIEVIRGPGATIWGANAVNGVINIVTKRASETQGGLVVAGVGDHAGEGAVRYGTTVGEHGHLRIHVKYADVRRAFDLEATGDAADAFDMLSGGVRYEYTGLEDKAVVFQGDLYNGSVGETWTNVLLVPPFATVDRARNKVSGGNILTRIEHVESDDTGWSVQAYYDRDDRGVGSEFTLMRETFDVELRHHFLFSDTHAFIWGLGYRHRHDNTNTTTKVAFDPDSRRVDKVSAFFQSTLTLLESRMRFMFGSKLEFNNYSGLEVQPGVRVSYALEDNQAVWLSIARAVRTPSRFEHDLILTPAVLPGPFPIRTFGDNDVESEDLLAVEAGYRAQPSDRVTVDLTAFFNDYRKLIVPVAAPPSPVDTVFKNDDEAKAYGAEAAVNLQVCESCTLQGTYSFYKLNIHGTNDGTEREAPKNQASLRLRVDVTEDIEVNANVFYVDNLSNLDVSSYARLDAGMTWRACEDVEVSIWGVNLADSGHTEHFDQALIGSRVDIPRSVFATVIMGF